MQYIVDKTESPFTKLPSVEVKCVSQVAGLEAKYSRFVCLSSATINDTCALQAKENTSAWILYPPGAANLSSSSYICLIP